MMNVTTLLSIMMCTVRILCRLKICLSPVKEITFQLKVIRVSPASSLSVVRISSLCRVQFEIMHIFSSTTVRCLKQETLLIMLKCVYMFRQKSIVVAAHTLFVPFYFVFLFFSTRTSLMYVG